MPTTTDTIQEIRDLRDKITHLLEEMQQKAGKENSADVNKEAYYALHGIGFQVHDSMRAVKPSISKKINVSV